MGWSRWFDFTATEVANTVPATCGVFCLARVSDPHPYPTGPSLTIYLGVASDRQHGLRATLTQLATGRNARLQSERERHGGLRFCFQANLDTQAKRIFEGVLELFERNHGASPVCNTHGAP